MPHSILIVEDDLTFATMLKTWLGKKGFSVDTASSNARARKQLDAQPYDLVLSDLRLPDQDGIFLLSWMKEQKYNIPLIIMTGYADIQSAVQAIKHGASDYISKPIQPDELLKKINEALQNKALPTPAGIEKNTVTPKASKSKAVPHSATVPPSNFLEGESEAARQLYNYVGLVAPTPMSVLINGASGTGKEYVAHRIHQLSKRADKPFIAIDCGSIPKELAASEFFGHVKGSFTGALNDKTGAFVEANGGTLFLDEIGNLPYHLQAKLLTAIQRRSIVRVGSNTPIPIDIRLICATNRNLQEMVDREEFREDLLYRINTIHIEIPPLRKRKEDIIPLAERFIIRFCKQYDKEPMKFSPAAKEKLIAYPWYGNIRELEHAIEKVVIINDGLQIPAELFQLSTRKTETSEKDISTLEEMEIQMIRKALDTCAGNLSAVAAQLGITRQTLYNKMKKFGL